MTPCYTDMTERQERAIYERNNSAADYSDGAELSGH